MALPGYDLVGWYTVAWFDRNVKCTTDACREEAEARLRTDRWRNDPRGGSVDPTGDRNVFSFYLRSRYALTRSDGSSLDCDDMRRGCATMGSDGLAPNYDLVDDAYEEW